MSHGKPMWELLKECAEKLTRAGKTPFTRGDLIKCVQQSNPEYGKNSLNPMIQGITENLKGGAPGGDGKNILRSVGTGQFVLNVGGSETTYPSRKSAIPSPVPAPHQTLQSQIMATYTTEDEIRDSIMQILYIRLGAPETWSGEGKTASFNLKPEFPDFICEAENPLPYILPNKVTLTHKSDILISNHKTERYISIEIKHRSAVTDQFKCRSYDMHHLRQHYGKNLLGILVYVKADSGISVDHARDICYEFHHFFAIPSDSRNTPTVWEPFIQAILSYLKEKITTGG
jgi:hypothetical protein